MRLPCAAMCATFPTSLAGESRTSSTADWRVSSMLVPVSPSGTGKTLSRLTSSWLDASQFRLPSSACLRSWPSTFPERAGSARAAIFLHPLHEHVHAHHRHSGGALDLELHCRLQVVRHLGDPHPVVDDHVDDDLEPA